MRLQVMVSVLCEFPGARFGKRRTRRPDPVPFRTEYCDDTSGKLSTDLAHGELPRFRPQRAGTRLDRVLIAELH